MSIAEDRQADRYQAPTAHRPLVPPHPPRAPDTMTAFGRMRAMGTSAIGTWAQRAYEEDIVRGSFFGRNSFIINTPEAIRHLVAQVGASQLVLGSDYPFPWQLQPVDHIFACTSLSDDEKADILGRTAAKLVNVQA